MWLASCLAPLLPSLFLFSFFLFFLFFYFPLFLSTLPHHLLPADLSFFKQREEHRPNTNKNKNKTRNDMGSVPQFLIQKFHPKLVRDALAPAIGK